MLLPDWICSMAGLGCMPHTRRIEFGHIIEAIQRHSLDLFSRSSEPIPWNSPHSRPKHRNRLCPGENGPLIHAARVVLPTSF